MDEKRKEIELKTKESDNPITLILYKDSKAIAFSSYDAESFIYLYKDQVAKLVKTLKKHKIDICPLCKRKLGEIETLKYGLLCLDCWREKIREKKPIRG